MSSLDQKKIYEDLVKNDLQVKNYINCACDAKKITGEWPEFQVFDQFKNKSSCFKIIHVYIDQQADPECMKYVVRYKEGTEKEFTEEGLKQKTEKDGYRCKRTTSFHPQCLAHYNYHAMALGSKINKYFIETTPAARVLRR